MTCLFAPVRVLEGLGKVWCRERACGEKGCDPGVCERDMEEAMGEGLRLGLLGVRVVGYSCGVVRALVRPCLLMLLWERGRRDCWGRFDLWFGLYAISESRSMPDF